MKYEVLRRVQHDGQDFDIGTEIDLSEMDAKPLLECGAIEPKIKRFGKKIQPTALNASSEVSEYE